MIVRYVKSFKQRRSLLPFVSVHFKQINPDATIGLGGWLSIPSRNVRDFGKDNTILKSSPNKL